MSTVVSGARPWSIPIWCMCALMRVYSVWLHHSPLLVLVMSSRSQSLYTIECAVICNSSLEFKYKGHFQRPYLCMHQFLKCILDMQSENLRTRASVTPHLGYLLCLLKSVKRLFYVRAVNGIQQFTNQPHAHSLEYSKKSTDWTATWKLHQRE